MGRDVDEVIAAIEQRTAAAQAEIASLEAARSVLAGVDALAGKASRPGQTEIGGAARPRSRSAIRRRRPGRPSGADVAELKRLLAEVDGGMSGSALAELAGVPPATVRAQLRELERSGEVRSAGERTRQAVDAGHRRGPRRAARRRARAVSRHDIGPQANPSACLGVGVTRSDWQPGDPDRSSSARGVLVEVLDGLLTVNASGLMSPRARAGGGSTGAWDDVLRATADALAMLARYSEVARGPSVPDSERLSDLALRGQRAITRLVSFMVIELGVPVDRAKVVDEASRVERPRVNTCVVADMRLVAVAQAPGRGFGGERTRPARRSGTIAFRALQSRGRPTRDDRSGRRQPTP